MLSLKIALRSVTRRGWTLLLVVVPTTVLFAMLTLVLASEASVQQLSAQTVITRRSLRIGSVDGVQASSSQYTWHEVHSLESIPGVTFGPAQFCRCKVDVTDQHALNCGATNRTYVAVWESDMPVSTEELDRWDAVKNGAIVSRAAATEHHWKVGDAITIKAGGFIDDGPPFTVLKLVITSISEKYIDPTTVYIHYEYVEQVIGKPLYFWVVWGLVDKPERRQAVMDEIERRFNEVKRLYMLWPMEVSHRAILSGADLMLDSIRVAGGFSLLLVLGVTLALLALSIEQRNTELAAMMAIGFRRATLARSVLAEGALMLVPAAALGALGMWVAFHDHPIQLEIILNVTVQWESAAIAVAGGALLGLLVGAVPAWRVYRLDILSSLR